MLRYLLLFPLAACQADTFTLYAIALGSPSLSDGCWFPDSSPPPDQADDRSNERARATWALFEGPDDSYLLDVGDAVLEGSLTDDSWRFQGERVDVQYTMPDGTGDKYTTTELRDIEMTEDRGSVTGSITTGFTFSCAGPTCGPAIPECLTTAPFIGNRVEGVEIDVDLQAL